MTRWPMIRWCSAGVLLFALSLWGAIPAAAQQGVPIHHHQIGVGTNTGTINLLPARVRSYFGISNASGSTLSCTFDGTTATALIGWLIFNNTTHVFDTKTPTGPLRCYAGDAGLIQVLEGR